MNILERRIKFRHFSRDEYEVFKTWVDETKPDGYIETDVHLESIESLEVLRRYPDWPPEGRRVYMKRIDAVWYRPGEIWLLEVKKRISNAAVGALLTYKMLFTEQRKPMKPVRLGIIARYTNLEVQRLCNTLGIKFWIVPGG